MKSPQTAARRNVRKGDFIGTLSVPQRHSHCERSWALPCAAWEFEGRALISVKKRKA